MIEVINEPDDCPFQRTDYDGFPDGCKYDETKCYNHNEFPEDCPLNDGDITVTKG
jgi:hypothetical protein